MTRKQKTNVFKQIKDKQAEEHRMKNRKIEREMKETGKEIMNEKERETVKQRQIKKRGREENREKKN